MTKLLNLYRLLNILSMDVALGAVCCAAWFAKVFNVQLRPYALLALGFTVWIIYTADHLMDAVKIKKQASSERHRFHQKYFNVLLFGLVSATLMDVIFLFFIRTQIIYAGLILIGIVILYLLVSRLLGFVKELTVAIVYTGGVLLPALSINNFKIELPELLLIGCFFLTCFINLVLFSWYDLESDRTDGYQSLAIKFGSVFTRKLIVLLFAVQVVFLAFVFLTNSFQNGVVVIGMNAVLFLLFLWPTCFRPNENFRLLGDAVFVFPAVLVLVG